MPEKHSSANQDGPTVNAAGRILLLGLDDLGCGQSQVTCATGVVGEAANNTAHPGCPQVVIDLEKVRVDKGGGRLLAFLLDSEFLVDQSPLFCD